MNILKHRSVAVTIVAAGLLAGCAAYRAHPLNLAPPLKPGLAALDRTLPGGGSIDTNGRLAPPQLAALAVLNDPDLAAARAGTGLAHARVFAAGLLPDPNIQGGFGALLGGPAVAPSISGALTQDLAALVTRGATIRAARARAAEIDANVTWQEFQIATRAETLAISLYAEHRSLAAIDRAREALRRLVATANRAVAAGNLAIDQASAAEVSLAGLDAARNATAEQAQADHAALAALLGVTPGTPIPLARPAIPALTPEGVARLVRTLAIRRPDLIALRYGYRAADADLRAAILAQFPLVSLTVNGGSDTSRVATVGPSLSLNLPIFNRNRGNIAVAKATRRQLHAGFTASLAAAEGGAKAAARALALLERERATAAVRLAAAERAARDAHSVWRQGLIDSRAETDLIDQAANRRIELIALDQKIAAGRIALAGLLGAGLPPIRTLGGAA